MVRTVRFLWSDPEDPRRSEPLGPPRRSWDDDSLALPEARRTRDPRRDLAGAAVPSRTARTRRQTPGA